MRLTMRRTVLMGLFIMSVAICVFCALKVTGGSPAKNAPPEPRAEVTSLRPKSSSDLIDTVAKRVKIKRTMGQAVFALTRGKEPEGKPDFYMADLSTGKITLITRSELLPSDFTTEPMHISLSPNAQYIAAVSIVGIDSELWVWKIGEKPRRVFAQQGITLSPDCWSSSSRYVMFQYSGFLCAYDMKLHKIVNFGEIDCAAWSAREDTALLVVPRSQGCMVTAVNPATMQKRKAFVWKNLIQSMAQSPNGSDLAISDTEGVYFRAGGKWRRSKIGTNEDGYVAFSYNKDGSKVAVFGAFSSGEPAIRLNTAMWCSDRTGQYAKMLWSSDNEFRLLLNTGDSYSNSGLVGWTPDSKFIVLESEFTISTDADDIASQRHDEFSLSTTGSQEKYGNGELTFDSGPGCLGLCYLARKR